MSSVENYIEEEIVPTKKLFYNNSFGIYGAVPRDVENHPFKLNEYGSMTIKGRFQELTLDVPYKVKLEEVNDKKYGLGYQVHSIYRDAPKTKDEQRNFLYSILTDLQVNEIYRAFPDEDVIELFKNDTLDYNKIRGIGKIVYERIRQKVLENVEWQDLFAELGQYGIKFDTLRALVEIYGTSENAIQKVKENPYVLTMISGIGFKTADKIAFKMGMSDDSPFRIQASIRHVIGEEEKKGHTYTLRDALVDQTVELLILERGMIEEQIKNTDGLHIDGDRIALYKTYRSEYEVAKMLIDRNKNSKEITFDLESFLYEQEIELGIKLTDKQKEFFYNFLKYNVNFLIGSAGCGKSMLQKILIRLIKRIKNDGNDVMIITTPPINVISKSYTENNKIETQNGFSYRMLAPTGRAAKILSLYVDGEEASTIHRAIGFGKRSSDDEIQARTELREDVILTDETGMVDIKLENAFLKKVINQEAKLVYIGDAAQIPSIGAGNFLKDCIDSGVFSVTVLDKVFRQEEGGMLNIVTKIRKGEKFVSNDFVGEKKFGKDTILRSVDQIHMEKGYKHYYNALLKSYSPEDIMVLSYTKKGTLGTVVMNKHIQAIVNPSDGIKKELKYHDDCTFRIFDYVMNTKNTYETFDIEGNIVDIMNGDSGTIVDIVRESDIKDTVEKRKLNKNNGDSESLDIDDSDIGYEHLIGIYVKFDFGTVAIPFEKMDQLMHSWSLTKHKSQGGSCKAGIVIVDKAHKFNSNANLVYTGATRCKEKLVILCQSDSLNFVLNKFENMSRRTFLKEILIKLSGEMKGMESA